MANPLLYNIDPEQYSLGRSTGRFNAVRQNAAVQPGADTLTAFLASLTVPVKPELTAPVAPVLPETLPTKPTAPVINVTAPRQIDPAIVTRTRGFSSYEATAGANLRAYMNGPSSGNTGKNDYDWHKDMLNRAYGAAVLTWDQNKRNQAALNASRFVSSVAGSQPGYWTPILQQQQAYDAERNTVNSYKPEFDRYNSEVAAYQSGVAAAKPQIEAYNAAGIEYNKQMEPIKAEVDRYNTELSKYKTIAEQFNAEVAGYFGARDGAVNQFMADRQNMDVTGQQQQSRGQQLAGTSTYADDLHQQMLDRIGEVNLEAQQQQQQSSIYSQA